MKVMSITSANHYPSMDLSIQMLSAMTSAPIQNVQRTRFQWQWTSAIHYPSTALSTPMLSTITIPAIQKSSIMRMLSMKLTFYLANMRARCTIILRILKLYTVKTILIMMMDPLCMVCSKTPVKWLTL